MAPPAGSDPASDAAQRAEEERVERLLGTLLRVGVLVAAAVVLTGGIVYLFRYGGSHPSYGRFAGEPGDLTHATGVVRSALALRPRGVIQFGLLLLVATPVMRVAFSLVAFVRERDRTYVGLTAFVLLILLLSLFGLTP
ncbi:MAG TPA: DUF1634 domain-containing protein [Gemmatimonadales bacterium]|nr:DUF1634 domain-containing protein [Gemmatimonadales bacterium]